MIFIGDYIALALVCILFLFYFDGKNRKYLFSPPHRLYVICLLLTAATALIDLIAGYLLLQSDTPLWLNIFINTLYFFVSIITTSCIALFLFTKILEHAHDNHCMICATRGLRILFSIYTVIMLSNLWTGFVFYFDGNGVYHRGPFNSAGHLITLGQMVLLTICFIRNRKNANQAMKRILIQGFPIIVVSIIIQYSNPSIMLNSLIMAMVDTALFLTFQGQRPGVHTLTRLNDRHRFYRDVETRLAAGDRFQVLSINIKNFGIVNQKYGHLVGDEILYQFAFSLEQLIKNSVAFHMNGTVFALTLPYTSRSAADEHCGTLLEFMENGLSYGGEQIPISYIVAEYISEELDHDAEEFYEKLEYAATLAYQQKHRYIRYSPDIGTQMHRTRYLTERLQTVDRTHGFQVWYQPICCMRTGAFCSMEALIRLIEPDGTIVSPGEFIPVAEHTGQINSVTWFVLDEVCRFLAAHPELDVSVSINLPMTQLLERGFLTRLNSTVDSYDIQHRRICIEFTERNILENFERTKEIMLELTQDGYRFYLDDFGTGYSNFNCLLQLPFQFIKLDATLTRSEENTNLVHTLTSLFHGMDLEVIAEGAETEQTVSFLTEHGVDRIQGYYFAKPMSEDTLLDFYHGNCCHT